MDDHPGTLVGYRVLLTQAGYCASVARDASDAHRICGESPVDVVMIDLYLQKRDGTVLMQALRKLYPMMRCILFTGEESDRVIALAALSRPDGFFQKSDTNQEMLHIVAEVLNGRRCSTARIARAERYQLDSRLEKVTPAEREVWLGIAHGLTLKEIAENLGKSESTVDKQRTNVMSAMGVHKSSELARLAVELGILN